MNSWFLEAGLCLGLVLLAFALFHQSHAWLRRAGSYVLIGTSGLALWFWTRNWAVVVLGVSLWFVLPLTQAVWMSRRLRFSAKRKLQADHFDVEEFPEIHELTGKLRKEGFRMEGDYWLRPSPLDQGYRILVHEEDSIYAAISLLRYGHAALIYMIFATPGRDGSIWLTWNYPLAYGLMMPPHLMIHRCNDARSPEELFEQHKEFLSINKVKPKAGAAQKPVVFFEKLLFSTIEHNLREGLLHSSQPDQINYTWRGTAFVSWQVLREMVSS